MRDNMCNASTIVDLDNMLIKMNIVNIDFYWMLREYWWNDGK